MTENKKMKEILTFFWDVIKIILVALVIVIPVRHFLFQPFVVNGQSMEPNYSHGDYLLVDGISYRFRSPARGEVIVFRYPGDPSLRHIKRIIGLPGETLAIDSNGIEVIFDNGSMILDETSYLANTSFSDEIEVSLNENEFFVLGDNRALSFDSRRWGALPRDYIVGRVLIRAFPFSRAKKVEVPVYQ